MIIDERERKVRDRDGRGQRGREREREKQRRTEALTLGKKYEERPGKEKKNTQEEGKGGDGGTEERK